MAAEMVIAVYRPKPGADRAALLQLVREHAPALRKLGLASWTQAVVMTAADGTILEIFEWTSKEAVDAAHDHPEVKKMWDRFHELSDYVPLKDLAEAQGIFPHFQRLESERAHRVIHFEIPADDLKRCAEFYSRVFRWKTSSWGDFPYWLVDAGDEAAGGVNGAITKREKPLTQVTNIIEVQDLEAAVREIRAAGGTVELEKHAVPGVGWAAYARDTEGNLFGMMQPDPAAK
ncbi:MAG: hypothetical protein GMKNLPBB_01423 [Myxococcota bacterium]|nr:hypothetical protein [Myxococcota bacterium]